MYKFNVEKATENTINWIKDWFNKNGPDSPAVIGISGGKDSSVVAALCVRALGKDRVIGVQMPCGVQKDIAASDQLIEHLGIKKFTVNIKTAADEVLEQLKMNGIEPSVQTKTNLPARTRMITLYAISQSFHGRVANTCNMSEEYSGGNYSTLWGDGVGDFAPIINFTVTEIRAMGEYLGLPKELVHKVPIDGLAVDEKGEYLTDEFKIGKQFNIENFTYARIDKYLRQSEHDFSTEDVKKIEDMIVKGKFKRDIVNLPSAPACDSFLQE